MNDVDEIKEFLGHIQPKIGEAAFNEIWAVVDELERNLLFAFLKANENKTIPDYDSNKHLMIDAFLNK